MTPKPFTDAPRNDAKQDKVPCCKTVYHAMGNWGRSAQCKNRATVRRDGKPYCTTHDPVRQAARDKVRDAAFEAEQERDRTKHDLLRVVVAYDGELPAPIEKARARYLKAGTNPNG